MTFVDRATFTETERTLWLSVVGARAADGYTYHISAERADAAVLAYREDPLPRPIAPIRDESAAATWEQWIRRNERETVFRELHGSRAFETESAILDERESCAKIAESINGDDATELPKVIARRIRLGRERP